MSAGFRVGGGRRARIAIAALLVGGAGFCALTSNAHAGFKFVHKFGHSGTNAGGFLQPTGVAVDTEDVWISDYDRGDVQRFTLDGSYLNTLDGGAGEGCGLSHQHFQRPVDLAADPQAGFDYAYMLDSSLHRVFYLDDSGCISSWGGDGSGKGQFEDAAGAAMSPDFQHLYVTDQGDNRIQEFTYGGVFERRWGTQSLSDLKFPTKVAVSPLTGNVYVIDFGNKRIDEFGPMGQFIRSFGNGTGPGELGYPADIATDDYGRVYVLDTGNPGDSQVDVFSPKGHFQGAWGASGYGNNDLHDANAMGIERTFGEVYVVGHGGLTNEFRVEEFQPVPPETTFTGGPTDSSFTNDATPEFSFESSHANSTFRCRRDSGSWFDCSSPHTLSTLSEGEHTFAVQAIDKAGLDDPAPASSTFTVDLTPPDSQITTNPGTTTTDHTPTFEFTSTEPGTFMCKVDHDGYAPCTSPDTLDTLALGDHTFKVYATDQAGNADPTPAKFAFTVTP